MFSEGRGGSPPEGEPEDVEQEQDAGKDTPRQKTEGSELVVDTPPTGDLARDDEQLRKEWQMLIDAPWEDKGAARSYFEGRTLEQMREVLDMGKIILDDPHTQIFMLAKAPGRGFEDTTIRSGSEPQNFGQFISILEHKPIQIKLFRPDDKYMVVALQTKFSLAGRDNINVILAKLPEHLAEKLYQCMPSDENDQEDQEIKERLPRAITDLILFLYVASGHAKAAEEWLVEWPAPKDFDGMDMRQLPPPKARELFVKDLQSAKVQATREQERRWDQEMTKYFGSLFGRKLLFVKDVLDGDNTFGRRKKGIGIAAHILNQLLGEIKEWQLQCEERNLAKVATMQGQSEYRESQLMFAAALQRDIEGEKQFLLENSQWGGLSRTLKTAEVRIKELHARYEQEFVDSYIQYGRASRGFSR